MGRLLSPDADAYEPYSTRGPLPPSRNRDVPPDKYLVPCCVRDNEGEAQYSCPHLGCDGLSFSSARECHAHEDRYHAGPYRCGTCERLFAAQSALERHCAETGHGLWVCGLSGCDMQGVRFGDGREFENHVRAHEGLDEDALSECSAVGEMCLAVACHRFEQFFPSPAEWEKHAASLGHVRAISLYESFCRLDVPAHEFTAKIEAARGLRCDKSDCRRFGTVMSSPHNYFRHLEMQGHKDPGGLRAEEPGKRARKVCEEPECVRFGCEYRPTAFAKHVESATHVNAVRMGEALRKVALMEPSTPGPAAERASIVELPSTPGPAVERASIVGAPSTPGPATESASVAGLPTPTATPREGAFREHRTRLTTPTRRIDLRRGGPSVSPGSPDTGLPSPALTWREMWLEERNRALEDENKTLWDLMRRISER